MTSYGPHKFVYPKQEPLLSFRLCNHVSKGVPMHQIVADLSRIDRAQPQPMWDALGVWNEAGLPKDAFLCCVEEAISEVEEKFKQEGMPLSAIQDRPTVSFFRMYALSSLRKALCDALEEGKGKKRPLDETDSDADDKSVYDTEYNPVTKKFKSEEEEPHPLKKLKNGAKLKM